MKALILNGSTQEDKTLLDVQEVISDELKLKGWHVDAFMLHKTKIAGCLGCFGCWVKTPGICVINDAGREVARSVVQSAMMIFLTPVTFGGYSSELKKAVDRLIPIVSPFFVRIGGEVHHKPRYERYPMLVGLGVLPNKDEESERIFKTLISRNAINMHSPAHAVAVVSESDGFDEMRKEIHELFSKRMVQHE